MKCPVCNDVRMREVEKDGVLIDVCPDCKGVWLDRGELEKLMSEIRDIRPAFNEWYEHREDRYEDHRNSGHYEKPKSSSGYPQQGHYKPKKKKSALDIFGDLFD
ncbi:zf-TFIIB domain-containing protein [Paenibacillus sp. DXFW5]|uniref:Zf-TFIIB domain-containing protein n=1 Tax=Paenibacillus rhizolycopersici TaxID=2780073 RepID=A0ABS2HBS1_9BACL|nr:MULTISPECIES: zf-TFIIB domain-containing protein [Paenibacillus]MBM6997858.1 zf-TFIIB domain-containing protein [Paenibacillus rhizolycopersici]MUG88758.1 hypothetical protein [Paenibacillus timonensis]GIP50828.1 hypothetical protein J53TS2_44190 [Paenibacillus sp. J53TS2]